MALIKIVLIAAAVYYMIKLILRLVFPFVLKKLFEKMQERTTGHSYKETTKEGEVTIQHSKKETPKEDIQGEYVDFEEIK